MSAKAKPWSHETTIQKFWVRVKPCPNCSCLLFQGYLHNGWARLRVRGFPGCPGNFVWAHRYAYALSHGVPAPGHDIHHDHDRCHHRNCVNSEHLEAIDHIEHAKISCVEKYKAGPLDMEGGGVDDLDPFAADLPIPRFA